MAGMPSPVRCWSRRARTAGRLRSRRVAHLPRRTSAPASSTTAIPIGWCWMPTSRSRDTWCSPIRSIRAGRRRSTGRPRRYIRPTFSSERCSCRPAGIRSCTATLPPRSPSASRSPGSASRPAACSHMPGGRSTPDVYLPVSRRFLRSRSSGAPARARVPETSTGRAAGVVRPYQRDQDHPEVVRGLCSKEPMTQVEDQVPHQVHVATVHAEQVGPYAFVRYLVQVQEVVVYEVILGEREVDDRHEQYGDGQEETSALSHGALVSCAQRWRRPTGTAAGLTRRAWVSPFHRAAGHDDRFCVDGCLWYARMRPSRLPSP